MKRLCGAMRTTEMSSAVSFLPQVHQEMASTAFISAMAPPWEWPEMTRRLAWNLEVQHSRWKAVRTAKRTVWYACTKPWGSFSRPWSRTKGNSTSSVMKLIFQSPGLCEDCQEIMQTRSSGPPLVSCWRADLKRATSTVALSALRIAALSLGLPENASTKVSNWGASGTVTILFRPFSGSPIQTPSQPSPQAGVLRQSLELVMLCVPTMAMAPARPSFATRLVALVGSQTQQGEKQTDAKDQAATWSSKS
mmetsp:Transcript_101518/g.316556  ORF Transcript_101518/g.316556 Transcript_101518/m.316556 type:complete len:250 (-) Transcript_101518:392-1141(-)